MSENSSLSRLRDEDGQALVLAIMIIVVGLLLGLAAVGFAVNANTQSVHDERTRGAQQAADAGEQQQIYLQSSSSATEYGVANSLGGLLDCVVPTLGANLQVTGITLQVSDAGVCPQSASSATGLSTTWTSLDNENYYNSVFFPNDETDTGSGSGSAGISVEFPEIVSLGCHSASNICTTPSSANAYWRQLTNLQPTGPLNAIEGENDVTIKGGGSLLESLLPGLCNLLPLICSTTSLPSALVGGDILADNNMYLPQVTLGLNGGLGSVVTSLLNGTTITNLLTGSGGGLTDLLQSLGSTLEYGGQCQAGTSPFSSGMAQACVEGTGSAAGDPVTTNLNTNLTPVTGASCQEGNPQSNCKLKRAPFTLGTSAMTQSQFNNTLPVITGSASYSTGGDLVVNSGGVVTLTAGSYYFCNVQVNSGGKLQGPSTTGVVRIFILAPSQCGGANSNGSGGASYEGGTGGTNTQGNFLVAGCLTCLSTGTESLGTTVNGVTGVVDPSAFQIYVSGDLQDDTQVSIGAGVTPSVTQSLIVYAPTSQVTVTTSAAFEGSLIGYNVIVSATAVLQDLDLGNYPLSSVVASYQPGQTSQCDGSVDAFMTIAVSATPQQAAAAEAADTKGCT